MNPTRQPIPKSPAMCFDENNPYLQRWLQEIQEARRQAIIRHIRKQQFAHVFREDIPGKKSA